MKRKYELLYVLNGTLSDEELKAQMSRIQLIVEDSAEIEDIFVWGRQKMAYEINDIREGLYVIVHFTAEPEAPKEIERLLRIYDAVLRYLIVLAEGDFMPSVKRVTDDESFDVKPDELTVSDEYADEFDDEFDDESDEDDAFDDDDAYEADEADDADDERTEA